MLQIKIYRNLRTLWRSLGKKSAFLGVKTVFLGQEVHYYMVCIAYFTELELQICNYTQKRRICRKNCKYVLNKKIHGHFCSRRKAAKFCHPGMAIGYWQILEKLPMNVRLCTQQVCLIILFHHICGTLLLIVYLSLQRNLIWKSSNV